MFVFNIAEIFFLKKLNGSFILANLWLIASTILLTMPGSAFPKENWLDKIWFDKWVHIGMFSLLTIFWCRVINKKTARHYILIGLACLFYGIAMEFIQKYYIANRSFDIGDIIADGVGCFAGVIYCSWLYKKN